MLSSATAYLSLFLSLAIVHAADTTTNPDAATTTSTGADSSSSSSSSTSQVDTSIWVTGTLDGALTTYQTVYSQSFMSTYTSGTIISSGADTTSYDLSAARASASSASESTNGAPAIAKNNDYAQAGLLVAGIVGGALLG